MVIMQSTNHFSCCQNLLHDKVYPCWYYDVQYKGDSRISRNNKYGRKPQGLQENNIF